MLEDVKPLRLAPPPVQEATPPPPLPTAAPAAAQSTAAAEELDMLDQELRGLSEPRLEEEQLAEAWRQGSASVVGGTTAGIGSLEVVMEYGADEDEDGGLRDSDEDF